MGMLLKDKCPRCWNPYPCGCEAQVQPPVRVIVEHRYAEGRPRKVKRTRKTKARSETEEMRAYADAPTYKGSTG